MTRRALLIGCPTFGLEGVEDDVDRVDVALRLYDFERRHVTGPAATRDAILAALRRLIADTDADDAVLVYYSGHGGLAENRAARRIVLDGRPHAAIPEPSRYQYIVPVDHGPGNFRGIFSAELSALLAELTAITTNVTVVLDCCHATGTALAPRFRARAIPLPWAGDISEHLAWLRAQGYDLSMRATAVEGNPHAVRLVACAANQRAYEVADDEHGTRGGLLTGAFVELLREVHGGLPPSWDAIGKAIRERVRLKMSGQHPDVLGPKDRRLFTCEALARVDAFAYFEHNGEPRLRAGALHGIRTGDRFLVMPINAAVPDSDLALAELEADDVGAHVTRVKLSTRIGGAALPPGARAIRSHTEHRRHPVRVYGGGLFVAPLTAAIAASPRLQLAASDEPALAGITAAPSGALELRDDHGVLVRRDRADEDAWPALAPIVRTLEQLARVRELLELRGADGPGFLSPPIVAWGRIRPDGVEWLPADGATLHAGDRLVVKITSACQLPIHASVLGVGVDRSITLQSAAMPHGVPLREGETYVLGRDSSGQLLGLPLQWPDHTDSSEPQPLALTIVATDLPVDLRSLESGLHDARELLVPARTSGRSTPKALGRPAAPPAHSVIHAPMAASGPLRVGRVTVVHLSARVLPGRTQH